MHNQHFPRHTMIRPTKLVHHFESERLKSNTFFEDDLDISSINTLSLIAISGKIRAIPPSIDFAEDSNTNRQNKHVSVAEQPTAFLPQAIVKTTAMSSTRWMRLLKVALGLLVGIAILFLISRVINISSTFSLIQGHLSTIHGVFFTFLALTSFLCAFSVRGMRWRLFLLRICKISPLQAIKIFWIAVFLNFILPVQGGELGKSLILRHLKGVPISQSLPTVAMDKSLDLMPALFILASVAFIPSIHMNSFLWGILGLVSGLLIGIIFTVALMAWNQRIATSFVRTVLGILPKKIGSKIEAFALGFIQSLIEGASKPRTFMLAILLTALAITCDGLFAWSAFQSVGILNMNIEEAIFGYTTVTMFSVLPNPPGQVGSNELVDVMVFAGLLNFPKTNVLAMPILFHPLTALVMVSMGLLCLASLGLSLKSTLTMSNRAAVAHSSV